MLSNLSPCKGSRDHKVKRVGRGFSSGIGGRSTRGTKGQNARKSGNVRLGFEGGQMPLYRKVGKYGFNNYEFRKNIKAINIRIFDRYEEIKKFDRKTLMSMGILKKKDRYIKLIGDKTTIENVVFVVDYCSTKALDVLKANGNTVTIIDKG